MVETYSHLSQLWKWKAIIEDADNKGEAIIDCKNWFETLENQQKADCFVGAMGMVAGFGN